MEKANETTGTHYAIMGKEGTSNFNQICVTLSKVIRASSGYA